MLKESKTNPKKSGNGEDRYLSGIFPNTVSESPLVHPPIEQQEPERTLPVFKLDDIIIWNVAPKEELVATREEELHDKYLNERFKSIEYKFDQLLDSNKELRTDLKSSYRQVLGGIIVLVFTVGAGFIGIIIALITLMKLLFPESGLPTPTP